MDNQTKNEIQNQVEKMFSQFKADEKNKKIMEKIIGGLQKIANEKHDEALFSGYVVKQALMAKRTLDSDKATKADLQDELFMLINVCMAAPGVTIEYYTPEQEG